MTTKKCITGVLIIAGSFTLFSFVLPSFWFIAGSKPKSYEMGIDKSAGKDGKNAATIRSIEPAIDGFGTLIQDCAPGKFPGKRIRMSGWLKSKDLSDWAGLWLRIDTKTPVRAVAFDNMYNGKSDRAVKGTTDWKKYEIVLDVPQNASNIAYGILLVGTGQVWANNMNFEIVTSNIETTGIEMDTDTTMHTSSNPEPANLDFSKY